MKKYAIELDDDLSAIYEDIAKMSHKSTTEALQIILRRVIETMLKEPSSERLNISYKRKKNGSDYF